MTDHDWHTGMDVFLMNVIRSMRLVTPIIAERGGGAIINLSTFTPDPFSPPGHRSHQLTSDADIALTTS